MRRKITAELEKWKARDDRKSLLIKGARQIGKTYSILDFAEKNYPNVVYFDFNIDESASKAFDLKIPNNLGMPSSRYLF